MMKVTVYSYREFDEKEWFSHFAEELGIELVTCPDAPDMENAALAKGSKCINMVTSEMSRELLERLRDYGVGYVTTRTIGYDHIDLDAAGELGIQIANAPYGPNGVADYTVMLMLMCIRKMKCIMERNIVQDYTLKGIQGREMKDFTVGLVGTGRIGRMVLQNLSGFGAKLLAYDPNPHPEAEKYGEYVDLETIWREADMITFHTPLTDENYHMVNRDTIDKMKKGVILINTARGALMDSTALIEGIESGKIGGAGLDVVENEFELYYYDRKSDILCNRELALLKSYPNVTVTHHMAFYTDQYIRTVIGDSLRGCKCFVFGEDNPWVIKQAFGKEKR